MRRFIRLHQPNKLAYPRKTCIGYYSGRYVLKIFNYNPGPGRTISLVHTRFTREPQGGWPIQRNLLRARLYHPTVTSRKPSHYTRPISLSLSLFFSLSLSFWSPDGPLSGWTASINLFVMSPGDRLGRSLIGWRRIKDNPPPAPPPTHQSPPTTLNPYRV